MSYTFDNYIVRPVLERDRAYLEKLIREDPYHRDNMDADWFIRMGRGEGAWAIENAQGRVVLYFKTQNAVRLSVQFGELGPATNRDALTKGLAWIENIVLNNGFCELIFDTRSPELKATARKRLGFLEVEPGTMSKWVTAKNPIDAATGLGRATQGHMESGGPVCAELPPNRSN